MTTARQRKRVRYDIGWLRLAMPLRLGQLHAVAKVNPLLQNAAYRYFRELAQAAMRDGLIRR